MKTKKIKPRTKELRVAEGTFPSAPDQLAHLYNVHHPMPLSGPLKFDVPETCRLFTPFPRLPFELRQQIWLDTLPTSGIHFLKIETREGAWQWADSRFWEVNSQAPSLSCYAAIAGKKQDEIAHEVKNEIQPRLMSSSGLNAASPVPIADQSAYKSLRKHLVTLYGVNAETANLVRNLTAQDKSMRLTDGSLVSLHRSSDVVYLEYLPEEFFSTGGSLGFALDCPLLDCVRRLAVRYCRAWEREFTKSCAACGQVHDKAQESDYPNHLYQFLARHLPQLEEFYFIDYFMVPRSKMESGCGNGSGKRDIASSSSDLSPPSLQSFQAQNATYHEATDKHWNMRPEMMRVKAWLQNRFVRYAKASKFSRHPHPERVRFGILASEWAIHPPASPTTETPPRKMARVGRSTEESPSRRRARRRRLSSADRVRGDPMQGIRWPVYSAELPVVFGEDDVKSFPFTFRMPRV